jgi:HTH-type transcriptional regulator / antitoxin HigA
LTATASIDPRKYRRLLAKAMPVVVQTDKEYERMLAEVATLMPKGKLTPEEDRLFDLMVKLIQDYEDAHYPPLNAATPRSILLEIMEARGVKPKDLFQVIGSKGHLSEILSGRRGISKAQAKRLADFFRVSVELFI